MRRFLLGILGIILISLGVWFLYSKTPILPSEPVMEMTPAAAALQGSYTLDGDIFTLTNGVAEKQITPGSEALHTVNVFGEPVTGDLDGDGDLDAAVLLVDSPGGTGVFFYAALVINKGGGIFAPTNVLFIGDRIAPQTVEIQEGHALYNFAVRKGDEPMTAQPSIGRSVWVKYNKTTGEIGEWVKGFEGEASSTPTSFVECEKAGYPIMESYPRQCHVPGGSTYTEDISASVTYTKASADMITVELPFPGAVTGRTFSVLGSARGTWFFEASFPVTLFDPQGGVLARSVAQADGDWMTTAFVPFKATLTVPEAYTGTATLVLDKDNPSGMPENDASMSFPITISY